MGYETFFEVDAPDFVKKALLDEGGLYSFEDRLKWYNHESDIRRVSQHFPNVLITVKGFGEGQDYWNDDIWVIYARNGSLVKLKASVVYPPNPFK
jgi:hypothetical protein